MNEADRKSESDRALGKQLRGSSLLLVGRMLSKVVNFAVQVAIVRLLSKDDFGTFAYGLALVLAGELVVKLGLGRGANRFVPDFAERGEGAKVLGTLALVSATILLLGVIGFALLLVVADLGWSGFPTGEGARVVLILSLLAPVQALDTICIQTLACYSRPREILFRKHVLGPGLRAAAVAFVFFAGGSSEMLAVAYLAGGLFGLAICLQLTYRQLRQHGVLPLPVSEWQVPWRPLFRFSIPLISSDLVFIALTAVTTVFLMTSHGEQGVAAMRAIVPAAGLNAIVVQSFGMLFMPGAVRLHARGDLEGLRDHHWQSVAWVAILSFPVFALTVGVAPGFVPLLFGADYAESTPLLAILSAGYYFGVCLAFNAESLQVLRRTRSLVRADLATVGVGLGLGALLCPTWGPLGAAIAVTTARVVGTLARHFVLLRTPGFMPVPAIQKEVWSKVAVAAVGVVVIGWMWQPPFVLQILLTAGVSIWLLRSTARSLDLARSFPELARVPFFARLVGA